MLRQPWRMLLFVMPLLAAACADSLVAPRPLQLAPPVLDAAAARDMVNAYRRDSGLPPLDLDSRLMRAAEAHAGDLAGRDRLSHRGSDGSDPWLRVRRAGFEPQLAAENVGAGQADFAEVFRNWQDSRSHDQNLRLPDATHMGVAVVYDPDTSYQTFWALVFGAPRGR